MPWTVADVDQHKKGLSDKEKEKWVKIANNVLEVCESTTGNSDCDVHAIRIANSKVGGKNGNES